MSAKGVAWCPTLRVQSASGNDGNHFWLSSPVTGPYHFLHDGKAWRSKAGDDLFRVLSDDLKIEIKD